VSSRVGLDTEARGKILLPLSGIEPLSPSRPVSSQTLYSLSYPGSHNVVVWNIHFPLLPVTSPPVLLKFLSNVLLQFSDSPRVSDIHLALAVFQRM
jgi:hypothetical protein